jgi:anti-sigma B factor antagonist
MPTSKVKATTEGKVRLLALQGEFVGGNETDDLRDALAAEAKEGTTHLLIDMAGATYLNSTALGVLIAAHTNFTKRGAKVALCNLSSNIKNIFVITKLTLVFSIYDTRQEGLTEMSREEVTGSSPDGYIDRSL